MFALSVFVLGLPGLWNAQASPGQQDAPVQTQSGRELVAVTPQDLGWAFD